MGAEAGRLEFEATVDGDVLIRVQGDRVETVILSGDPVRIEDVTFENRLPRSAVSKIDVTKTDGRGEVVLLQGPSETNDFTAIIQITDDRGGADRYGFRLTWTP